MHCMWHARLSHFWVARDGQPAGVDGALANCRMHHKRPVLPCTMGQAAVLAASMRDDRQPAVAWQADCQTGCCRARMWGASGRPHL
jgi:hypothetical protein